MMTKGKLSLVIGIIAAVLLVASGLVVAQSSASANQAKQYYFVFISHGGEENPFWSEVYKGFTDAIARYGLKGTFYRPPREADLEWQLSTWKAVLAKHPDGIITTIPDANMFDAVIKEAIGEGIPVLASNCDDPEGAEGNARLAFIGQRLADAGYMLAKEAITKYFPGGKPAPKSLKVLVTIGAPGAVWAERRKSGIMKFLAEYGVPQENISVLDTTMDISKMQSRVLGFIEAHPDTNMILSVQYSAGGYLAAKSLGLKPGKITIAGFDLVPTVLKGIKEGYIAFTVNQQPYLQGYLPVVELYLMKAKGMGAWDVNTGMAIVDKTNLAEYMK